VLEFFWYGCPHCNALEPLLRDWVKKLPSDVAFRKVHVALGPSWVPHQQLFYTLDAGQVRELDERVFKAMHVDGQSAVQARAHGRVRGQARASTASSSPTRSIRSPCAPQSSKATQQAEAYRVDGVPAMSVNGKWYTAPSMAGGNAPVLRVLDHLIELERKARK
jgi:thiol:disulfide interchange protein DsbA